MKNPTRKSSNDQAARQQSALDASQFATIAVGLGLAFLTEEANAAHDRRAQSAEEAVHSPAPAGHADHAVPHAALTDDIHASDDAALLGPSVADATSQSAVPNSEQELTPAQGSEGAAIPDVFSPETLQDQPTDSATPITEPSSLSETAYHGPEMNLGSMSPGNQPSSQFHDFDLSQLNLDLGSFSDTMTLGLDNLAQTLAQTTTMITGSLNAASDLLADVSTAIPTEFPMAALPGEGLSSMELPVLNLGFIGQSYIEHIDLPHLGPSLSTPLHGLV